MSDALQLTMERVQDHMDDILTSFKDGAKITVFVRTPGKPNADFCMTSDDLDEVQAMVIRRKHGEAILDPAPPVQMMGTADLNEVYVIPRDLTDEELAEIKYNVDRKADTDIPLWRIQEAIRYANFIAGSRGLDIVRAAVEVASPSPEQTPPVRMEAQPFAWYWHDQHGCLYITGDDRKPDVPAEANPLYEHPPQSHVSATVRDGISKALIAMKLAAELPGVANEYDFTDAIAATQAAWLEVKDGNPSRQSHLVGDIEARSVLWNCAINACAALIENNIIMDTSAGKVLAPRQDGNRDGLHYATAIRALTTEGQP